MIVAIFAVFMICLQITARGADSQLIEIVGPISRTEIANKCQTIVHRKCQKESSGTLIKIAVDLPVCRLLCYTRLSDGTMSATLTWTPNYMPCLVGNVR
uniref:Putative salp15 n=1 Tax=Ixodes ricinus TaxID=34613 RepID=A0A0K8RF92_IXORI